MMVVIWFIVWWAKGFPEFNPWDVWFVTFIICMVLSLAFSRK